MKQIVSIILAVILTFSVTACAETDAPAQTDPPGSNGPSQPAFKEPPVLKILDSTRTGIEANLGTYSWTYDNGDGTHTAVCADSSHPLQWQNSLTPMTTAEEVVELVFDVEPQTFVISCWSDDQWGKIDAAEETVHMDGCRLELKEGGYIYEVVATWTGENLAAEGTAYYGFYVVRQATDDHTTIIKNEREYTFTGSDSVALTYILTDLPYDPDRICNCLPEFTVRTEDGKSYGVNLSEGYARWEAGQASLTPDQAQLIQKILNEQT